MPAPTPPPAAATRDYSAPLRVWHWGNALLVAGQLLTILFLKVIVQPKSAIPEFRQELGKSGVALTEQQGRALAHIISERIWDWHIGIGLTLAAFWVYWLVVQLTAPTEQRFGARLAAAAWRFRQAPPVEHPDARRTFIVKLTYLVFYLLLTVIVLTGLALTWADEVAWLRSLEHSLKQVHNVAMYLIIAFVAVHIVGVVWAELMKEHGLISRMVSGDFRKSS